MCVSLFYVNDISSTGSRGRAWGFPVYTFLRNSDAGYAVLPLTLLGAVVGPGVRDRDDHDHWHHHMYVYYCRTYKKL